MKWNTAISKHEEGALSIRGVSHASLMQEHSFSEAAFLLLSGHLPSSDERAVFDAMLVSSIEHGVEAPSAFSARVSASVGNPLHIATAAGILATGDHHGGAIEAAADYFKKGTSAKEVLDAGAKYPGFGHKLYKDLDPRAQLLLSIAEKHGFAREYVTHARAVETELRELGKPLPLNIDGALAALMLELGLSPRLGKALFVFARMPGIIAHSLEEVENEKPYRRISDTDVTYTGP
jgi:citryl-CoA lyase